MDNGFRVEFHVVRKQTSSCACYKFSRPRCDHLHLDGKGGVLGVAVQSDDARVVLSQFRQSHSICQARGHLDAQKNTRTTWGKCCSVKQSKMAMFSSRHRTHHVADLVAGRLGELGAAERHGGHVDRRRLRTQPVLLLIDHVVHYGCNCRVRLVAQRLAVPALLVFKACRQTDANTEMKTLGRHVICTNLNILMTLAEHTLQVESTTKLQFQTELATGQCPLIRTASQLFISGATSLFLPASPLPLKVLATMAAGLPLTVPASWNAFASASTSCPSTTYVCHLPRQATHVNTSEPRALQPHLSATSKSPFLG